VNSISKNKRNDPKKIESAINKMNKDLKKGKVKNTKGKKI